MTVDSRLNVFPYNKGTKACFPRDTAALSKPTEPSVQGFPALQGHRTLMGSKCNRERITEVISCTTVLVRQISDEDIFEWIQWSPYILLMLLRGPIIFLITRVGPTVVVPAHRYLLGLGSHSSSFISFTLFIHKPPSFLPWRKVGEPSGMAPLWMSFSSTSPVSCKHHLWANQTMRNSDPFSVHEIIFNESIWLQIALGFLALAPFRSRCCHCSGIGNKNQDCFHPPQPDVCL